MEKVTIFERLEKRERGKMEAEIDAVMVKIFELMEKYLEHRRRLQELMKNVFVLLFLLFKIID